jgi:hypothetical protein
MKKIIILLVLVISFLSCEAKEKKIKNGQILFDQKKMMLQEYHVEIDECNYAKMEGGYYFQAWFNEMVTGTRMYFEFIMPDEYGCEEYIDSGYYTIEANIMINLFTGNVYAYPIIRYSKKGNGYDIIYNLGE